MTNEIRLDLVPTIDSMAKEAGYNDVDFEALEKILRRFKYTLIKHGYDILDDTRTASSYVMVNPDDKGDIETACYEIVDDVMKGIARKQYTLPKYAGRSGGYTGVKKTSSQRESYSLEELDDDSLEALEDEQRLLDLIAEIEALSLDEKIKEFGYGWDSYLDSLHDELDAIQRQLLGESASRKYYVDLEIMDNAYDTDEEFIQHVREEYGIDAAIIKSSRENGGRELWRLIAKDKESLERYIKGEYYSEGDVADDEDVKVIKSLIGYIKPLEESKSVKPKRLFPWSEAYEHIDAIEDGATIEDGYAVLYDSGYQVAWHQSKEVKLNSLDAVIEYVKDSNLKSFGIWYDEEVHQYVLDTDTVHVDDLDMAIRIAKEANQKAIFDWANMKSIYLEDLKESLRSDFNGRTIANADYVKSLKEAKFEAWSTTEISDKEFYKSAIAEMNRYLRKVDSMSPSEWNEWKKLVGKHFTKSSYKKMLKGKIEEYEKLLSKKEESVSEGDKFVRLQTITEEELDSWFDEELINEWDETLFNLLSPESSEEFDELQAGGEEDEDFDYRETLEDLLSSDWHNKFSFEEKKEIYAKHCVDFMDFDEDPLKKYRDAGIEFVGDNDDSEDNKIYVKESKKENNVEKRDYVDPMILVDINWLQENDEAGIYFDEDWNPLKNKIRKDFKTWVEPNTDQDAEEYPYNLYASLPKVFADENDITLIDAIYGYPDAAIAYIRTIEGDDIKMVKKPMKENSMEKKDLYNKVVEEYFKMSKDELKVIASEAIYQLYSRLSPEEYAEAMKAMEEVYYIDNGFDDEVNAEDYAPAEPAEEDKYMEESTLNERAWKYKEPRGAELRNLIEVEDYAGILRLIYDIATYWAERLGEDDYSGNFEELASLTEGEWDLVYDSNALAEYEWDSAEELVDERLEQLYDAADDNSIWLELM